MAKYIDANLLIWKIKRQIRMEELNFAALGGGGQTFCINTLEWVLKQIDSLPDEQPSKDLDEATEKLIDEALYKWSHNDEDGKEQSFTHHEIDESLQDAVTHQMEDDGDVDDFVRKGIDNIALKYAELGAKWQAEHTEDYPMPEDTVLFQKGVEEGKRLMLEDAVEGLPKWKKNTGALRYGILEDEHGRYIQHDGYKLYFDDLLKLPKEDEQ